MESVWVRRFAVFGAIFALVSVAAGAFGAHGLRARLTPELLTVFETGARYQMYHGLALLATAGALGRWPSRAGVAAGLAFVIGILMFSGSLYLLALTGVRWLGAVTPFGGVAFLVGWACLAWCAARGSDANATFTDQRGRPDEHASHR
ncbi:MAG: hypothetical protein RIS35_3591 [Pseudomonadota bacterium]|jgi:uncharacterized membrane protein YgdD (TMEM256/DUF423 family)